MLYTLLLAAPFQPPTDEWEKIMEETRKQVTKVENDFVSVCQAKKVRTGSCVPIKELRS